MSNENPDSSMDMFKDFVLLGNSINDEVKEMLLAYSEKEFQEVVLHQFMVGGKRLRPALTLLFYEFLGGTDPNVKYGAAAIELLHNYTLIIDDIIDSGTIRRGEPTTRAKYGDRLALLSALLYREAIIGASMKTNKFRQLTIAINRIVKTLSDGERLDILFERIKPSFEYYSKYPYTEITVADYWEMVKKKTGSLFGLACEAGVILSDKKQSSYMQKIAYEFGELLGIAFQIMDDILDLKGDADFGKTFAKDLKEHKLGNLPILYVVNNCADLDEKIKLLDILTNESGLITDKGYMEAIMIIEAYGGFRFALEKVQEVVNDAKKLLKEFPNKKKHKIFLDLIEAVTNRHY